MAETMSEQLAELRGAVLARLGDIDKKLDRMANATEAAAKQLVDHERRLLDLERQRDATSATFASRLMLVANLVWSALLTFWSTRHH